MAGLTPSVAGVIRIPSSPRAMAASMAWIWVASSPSSLPAAVVIFTLFSLPAASAPCCMAMKNGLVLVFVISVTARGSPPPPPLLLPPLLEPPASPELPPQALRTREVAATRARPARSRGDVVWCFMYASPLGHVRVARGRATRVHDLDPFRSRPRHHHHVDNDVIG